MISDDYITGPLFDSIGSDHLKEILKNEQD
jgi:hypothetical protein